MTRYTYTDKVVVITGALGALGTSLCLGFADSGATVIAAFRGDVRRFERLKNQAIDRTVDEKIIPMSLDVTDETQVQQNIAQAVQQHGGIDILVNNAGINDTGPFMMQDSADWQRIVDTNLTGTRHLCAAVSRPMMARKQGVIINISSVLGNALGRGAAGYAASKAALNRFTEVVAVELGKKGIRVNGISPGLLETGLGESMLKEAEATALQRIPLGRKGTVDEITGATLFLASEDASYITGHILTIDGGLSHG